ncbi:gamma-glutamyltransferase [Thalassomonas actiniarum]|uniref:Glutathione hydrolase proenzyme n=1 Tax=Thalassomonas actiniarum TaxID=485447 RepID=A0AAE9YKN0_9GAMM|nr:gamma-glutamyltransferase [Thalassomonas actiniarum]WDD97107.1 gamma-glutamyltransferase [Thalassomonas actiniarum]
MYKRIITFVSLICISATISTTAFAVEQQAGVAMPDSYSADVAASILSKGGNAVDAAIAAQFVLAVTLPEAGNIGGGGFMLVHTDKQDDFIDYREVAPLKGHRDMYLDDKGNVIDNKSVFGVLSAGVPGTVAGMWLAHKKYGSLPWKSLLEPAVVLAEKGFVVHPKLAKNVSWYLDYLQKKDIKVNFAEFFGAMKAGEVFKQPVLASSLQRIRDEGSDGFYKGKTADIIVNFMKQQGGLISHQDLAQYQAVSRKPISQPWQGYQVLTSPPPSSGGIAILQWLNMYQQLAPSKGEAALVHNSKEYVHLLSEIGKRVFADRADYLGDPDFYPVPVKQLLDENYLKKRAGDVDLLAISTTEQVKPGLYESEDTTHFSIVDKWGNAVANTTTINLTFGSGVVVPEAGFILNDEMDDFSAKPGVANAFGALGGKANEIQPRKRMLSSMTPTILLKDKQVALVTGSPGGTTIISSVYQSILNVTEFGMSADEAVNSPRFHHQLYPENVIRHHSGLKSEDKKALQQMGYTLDNRHFGDVHLIINENGKLDAGSEAHGRGKALVLR